MIEKELKIQAIDEMGCCIYFSIKISDNTTLKQIVEEVKSRGYVKFRICDTMKVFADVI